VLNSSNFTSNGERIRTSRIRWVRFKDVEGESTSIYGHLEGCGISGDLASFCNDVSTTELQMGYVGDLLNNE
jgi:hypothetical protein